MFHVLQHFPRDLAKLALAGSRQAAALNFSLDSPAFHL
jgi:hypothetical protein